MKWTSKKASIFHDFGFFSFWTVKKHIVALLVESKADINARNKFGKTPCDLVDEKGKISKKNNSI